MFKALGFCRLTSAMTSSVHFLGVQQQPLLSANPLNDTQRANPSPMSLIFLQQPFPAQDNVAAAMLTFYPFHDCQTFQCQTLTHRACIRQMEGIMKSPHRFQKAFSLWKLLSQCSEMSIGVIICCWCGPQDLVLAGDPSN